MPVPESLITELLPSWYISKSDPVPNLALSLSLKITSLPLVVFPLIKVADKVKPSVTDVTSGPAIGSPVTESNASILLSLLALRGSSILPEVASLSCSLRERLIAVCC